MDSLPYLDQLIEQFRAFPGVGEKSARRMAFFLLQQPTPWVESLAEILRGARERIHPCPICGALTDRDPCPLCSDPGRRSELLCVVETPEDCIALEQSGVFRGRYHVLGGRVSPLEGEQIPPERLDALRQRIQDGGIGEVILAMNPRVEGDLTAFTVQESLAGLPVKLSRLACGLPVGGSIGFADRVTLHVAMEARQPFSSEEI